MKYSITIPLISLLLLIGCSQRMELVKNQSSLYFNSVPSDSSGIGFSNDLHHLGELNIIEYLYYYNGGGVAIGDINNDGFEDIYFTGNQTSDKLYLNLGNLKFKDITMDAGITMDTTWSTGVTMADINNDGLLDIYVSKVGDFKGLKAHNLLYINQGNNSFIESSSPYGLDFSGFSTQASFFDYDNDGDLDMYLMNHSVHTPRSYGKSNKRHETDSLSGDRLYENQLNEGLSNFIDVSARSGIYSSALGYGLALITSDINQDGLIDIYVGNDFHEDDYVYINQGDKTFKELGSTYLSHTSRFTMGVDAADLNNDSRIDLFTLDMMPFDHSIFLKSGGEDSDKISQIKKSFGFGTQYARNSFQLNRNNKSFSEIALMSETQATDWSWSVLIEDYDNDGLNDIFVSNGIFKRPNDLDYINFQSTTDFDKYNKNQQDELERKLIEEMPTVKIPNIVFRNKGELEFERLTNESGLLPSYSNGAAYSDLDNDGDLDIVVNNIDQKAFLLENKSESLNQNNYITIALSSDNKQKNPNGAKVYLYAEGQKYFKELTSTRGFQSSSSHKVHFGLGQKTQIDSLQVVWLDGEVQIEKGLTINMHHNITKNSTPSSIPESGGTALISLEEFPFIHIENLYNDYEREALIPEKLSVEGPALITADFNSDGLDDIFIGGARYQAAALYMLQKNGTYLKTKTPVFSKDLIYEDVDAETFDLDNDGDLDLYVMSGGNDKMLGEMHLEDRIYLNDGHANFERFNSEMIKTNGGTISAGDFDGDGYEDLFIGNRSVPGVYGLFPESYILRNTGESNFEIVENDQWGMVTDALWEDINNDELLDLIIVGDWMPVTILINKGEEGFINKTEKYGLQHTQGMWNTIAVTDLDGNGYKDIIAGNAGLNFKWKASKDRPVTLYLDDFDNNGQPDPLIFYNFHGNEVPFTSRDKLIGQIPSLKKKFLKYKDFSQITNIKDLTGKSEFEISEIKKISELRSMIFLNYEGTFKGIPLPKEAQMSSIEDLYVENTKEGPTVLFVGNYLGYVAELGDSDANSGGILSSFEKKHFKDFEYLPLPTSLNARGIIKIEGDRFLIVANDDKSFSIKTPINK